MAGRKRGIRPTSFATLAGPPSPHRPTTDRPIFAHSPRGSSTYQPTNHLAPFDHRNCISAKRFNRHLLIPRHHCISASVYPRTARTPITDPATAKTKPPCRPKSSTRKEMSLRLRMEQSTVPTAALRATRAPAVPCRDSCVQHRPSHTHTHTPHTSVVLASHGDLQDSHRDGRGRG